mgnify:CR=1 FL=1|jgi:hypothetical protein
MSAGRYPIYIEQGASLDFEVQYIDSDGNPVDLSGYSARMQIRPSVTSTTTYITLSSTLKADGTGLNLSGSHSTKPPTSGSIGVFISACSSSVLDFGEAVYDLELSVPYEGGCDYVTRLIQGPVKLSKEVTR